MFYLLKKKLIDFLPSILLLLLVNDKVLINGQGSLVPVDYAAESKGLSALLASKKASTGGSGEIVKANSLSLHEPSCEYLRAMWQFSRRQSRASEITNEIPTYHDPFAYNIFDPAFYPTTTRSMGGRRMHSKFRDGSARPVYGRVMMKPAPGRFQESPSAIERPRPSYDEYRHPTFGDNAFLANQKQPTRELDQQRRRQMKVRFGNGVSGTNAVIPSSNPTPQHAIFGSTSSNVNQNQITPQRGSFQRLKQLVWTERARELEDQRKKEAVAARAAILKDITNGQHYKTSLSSSSPSSSSSSSSVSQATRKPKGESNSNNGGNGGNKNKLLRNENKSRFSSGSREGGMQQFVANPSYWSANDNVKRSFIPQQQQYDEAPDVSMNDYYDVPIITADDAYTDDDTDLPYLDDANAYFNRINQDNINDFYYEINKLLSRKPNPKEI